MPIGNKPLIAYQVEYLERNGISNIIIVVEKRYLKKIEVFLSKHLASKADIEFVALQDEDESANVLKLLSSENKIQGDFILLQGDTLIDVPLDQVLETHNLTRSAMTVLLKELDFSAMKALKAMPAVGVKNEVDSYDMFGLAELKGSKLSQRLVYKASNIEAENMNLDIKPSLLR